MNGEQTVMLREIGLQPAYVRDNADSMYARSLDAVRASGGRAVNAVFAIGCGDSFGAALAARSYMLETIGRWTEPVEAMEFASYLVTSLPAASAVFGVSNSGTVTRTIEGIRLAREAGAWTFGVTAAMQSKLAATAQTPIEVNAVPNIKLLPDGTRLVTPGTLTYTASLLGLCIGAIALGEVLGTLSARAAAAAVQRLRTLADVMEEADARVRAAIEDVAASLAPDRTVIIIGGGPNAATAYYGMAKLYEAVQWPAHHAQTEEWAHEHYFITGPDVDTIAILPPGAARERGLEQLRAAREMGSRTIVFGAHDDAAARAGADLFVGLPAPLAEPLTPFVYKLPFEYLACRLAALHHTRFFNFDDPLRQQVNFRQIFAAPAAPADAQ